MVSAYFTISTKNLNFFRRLRLTLKKNFQTHFYRLQMNIDRQVDGPCISTCHGHRNRHAARPCPIKDHPVPARQTISSKVKAAQAVLGEGIGPRQVDQEVWQVPAIGHCQGILQRLQVISINRAVGKRTVQVGEGLFERVICGPVNLHGEHGGVVLKDAGGAIALMNIEIDDEHAWGKALGLHEPGRHGRIIKAAESTPPDHWPHGGCRRPD